MSSASTIFGTKSYVCARYFLRPGKCFKYIDQSARRGYYRTRLRGHGIISVLRPVKRYQKRGQDFSGI